MEISTLGAKPILAKIDRFKKTWGEAEIPSMEKAAREKELARVNSEAESTTLALSKIYDSSIKNFSELSKNLHEANAWLNTAEREYRESAYAPFWDAVENSARWLKVSNDNAKQLAQDAKTYYQKLDGKQHTFPIFPVQRQSFSDTSTIVKRLRQVVRKGQTNHDFAIILEHRKTQEIMIAGFRSLNEAVNNLGGSIESSIFNLEKSISSGFTNLVQEQIKTHESIDKTHDSVVKSSASVDKRLLEQNRMLDNIQNDLKPS